MDRAFMKGFSKGAFKAVEDILRRSSLNHTLHGRKLSSLSSGHSPTHRTARPCPCLGRVRNAKRKASTSTVDHPFLMFVVLWLKPWTPLPPSSPCTFVPCSQIQYSGWLISLFRTSHTTVFIYSHSGALRAAR